MNTEHRPKRLSLSEILEMVLQRKAVQHSSVGLSRTASGETVIDIRVAVEPDSATPTVADAELLASQVFDRLTVAYPAGEGHDGAAVSLSRNAKGETQIEVSLRTSDDGARTVEDAVSRAQAVYDATRMAYPMASGLTAKPGSVS